ncbi:hypothetical protein EPO44_00855, partial [bacterium]
LWLNMLRQSGIILSLPLLGSYDLSQIPAQFEPAKYERMIFGLILILMMIFRPQGILPPRQGTGPTGSKEVEGPALSEVEGRSDGAA